MKKYLVFIILFSFILGCSKSGVVEKEVDIINAFQAKNMTRSNASLCSGVYKNQIYYVEDNGDSFGIKFVNFKGELINRFNIPKGSGPGEAKHTLGARVYKNKVFFNDF